MIKEVFENCILYCADCREGLPDLKYDVVITDPVWPNVPAGMFDISESPIELMNTTAEILNCRRIVIVMRWDSDVRFLTAIPQEYKFVRVLNLPYNLPGRIGRTLSGMEHAYVFGDYPVAKGHKRILPGIAPNAPNINKDGFLHPCPRPQKHFDWLVANWARADEIVCDPFMGSGTTGAAAIKLGRQFIGIEIDQKYFDEACRKIEAAGKQLRLFGG